MMNMKTHRQHFLLSAKARTLSLKTVFQMGEDAAYNLFCQLRWPETDGEAYCPRCGCLETYSIKSRRQYKTAFVLTHKLREAMAIEQAGVKLDGIVEIDGAYFGGYVKPENRKDDRKDLRLTANRSGKRQCVVIMRERNGRSLPFIVAREGDAVPIVRDVVGNLATIYADEGTGWDDLHAGWDTHRVNHSERFMDKGVCTNQAESYFSRLRRMEVGTHHHIAGKYLNAYAGEAAWREDYRRTDNGNQAARVGFAAMASRQSRQWAGYWQRAA
jgi:hypothetical protein